MKWRRISGTTKPRILKILKILLTFPNFFLQKTVQYVRGQWLTNMCTKFQVDIFKNGWDMNKTCQKQALFTSFRDFTVIFRILFLTDFDASKSVLGSFFAFFAKIWPKNMYRSSKSRKFFAWPFFPGNLTWPWPLLWSLKHSKWYLQISMPISWLCLCWTSQFCSPMSPSPKCRTFWLWPDLWRHSWPRGQ